MLAKLGGANFDRDCRGAPAFPQSVDYRRSPRALRAACLRPCPWRFDKIMRRLESGTALYSASATPSRRSVASPTSDSFSSQTLNGQPHPFSDRARKEAADGMRLPAGGFHQFLRGGTALSFQQVKDLFGLATLAGHAFRATPANNA